MIKVLFISQWYPQRYDPMTGLFVQKHAEAIGIYCQVKVLYVHADENITNFEFVERTGINITECTVYYPCNKKNPFHKIIKLFNYLKAYWLGYKQITKDGFTPDIVHANVLTRTGFIAYLFKVTKHIPYVVTEHWTRYLPESFGYKGVVRKLITKLVVKNAFSILPVSETLKKAMQENNLVNSNYNVVNNVVDRCFFKNSPIENRIKKRMLHISCFFDPQKNIRGILRAALLLSKTRQDFELVFIGNGVDYEDIQSYTKELEFNPGIIRFVGEKTSEEVSDWLQNSDLFVLFSNYETAGVVIAESLVCGKPVISTKVGAVPEYVDKSNGLVIQVGDEKALMAGMSFLLDHYKDYNAEGIKENAKSKFSYESVGLEITEIYKQAIEINNKKYMKQKTN